MPPFPKNLTWLLSWKIRCSFCVAYDSRLCGCTKADVDDAAPDVDDGKLKGDASLRIGDEGCECVGVVAPEPPTTGQFLPANVFRAFTTVEPEG